MHDTYCIILLFINYHLSTSYYIQKNLNDPRLVNYIQKCTSKDLEHNRSYVKLEQRNYGIYISRSSTRIILNYYILSLITYQIMFGLALWKTYNLHKYYIPAASAEV